MKNDPFRSTHKQRQSPNFQSGEPAHTQTKAKPASEPKPKLMFLFVPDPDPAPTAPAAPLLVARCRRFE